MLKRTETVDLPALADVPRERRTSELLVDAIRGDSERVTVGEIINALDARAFGLAVLLFAIPSCVPMPPGVPTVVGVALLIVSAQMVIGRRELWLPGFLTRRSFSRSALIGAFERMKPWLERIEMLARPRFLFLTEGVGTAWIGLVVLIMALVLILPLPPGGNFPPALACAIMGIGLVERDGLIILFGTLASLGAFVAAWFLTLGFIEFLPRVGAWFAQLFGFAG